MLGFVEPFINEDFVEERVFENNKLRYDVVPSVFDFFPSLVYRPSHPPAHSALRGEG